MPTDTEEPTFTLDPAMAGYAQEHAGHRCRLRFHLADLRLQRYRMVPAQARLEALFQKVPTSSPLDGDVAELEARLHVLEAEQDAAEKATSTGIRQMLADLVTAATTLAALRLSRAEVVADLQAPGVNPERVSAGLRRADDRITETQGEITRLSRALSLAQAVALSRKCEAERPARVGELEAELEAVKGEAGTIQQLLAKVEVVSDPSATHALNARLESLEARRRTAVAEMDAMTEAGRRKVIRARDEEARAAFAAVAVAHARTVEAIGQILAPLDELEERLRAVTGVAGDAQRERGDTGNPWVPVSYEALGNLRRLVGGVMSSVAALPDGAILELQFDAEVARFERNQKG